MPFPPNIKDLHLSQSFPVDKGEVEEEIKDRITAVFSVAMLQNLYDYPSKD